MPRSGELRQGPSGTPGSRERVVMYQRWEHLLFVHWPVPASDLRPVVPSGLEIETHEGAAYISLVLFTINHVRPIWLPALPGLSSFHETNVRTYVAMEGEEPGVWFFSLEAANLAAVIAARWIWDLPYQWARMGLAVQCIDVGQDGTLLEYSSERRWPRTHPAHCRVRGQTGGPERTAKPGSLEHFLIERYLLYGWSGQRFHRGRVRHEPYRLRNAELLSIDENLLAADGITSRFDMPPICHYAERVDVEVLYPQRVSGGGRGRVDDH